MPRKPMLPTPPVEDHADVEAIRRSMDAAAEDWPRLQLIEIQYGDGSTFDLETSIARVRAGMEAAAESLLLAGRELIRIKEHVPHGEFQEVLRDYIGISPNTARRMMQAAAKFLDGPRRKLAERLPRTKLLELLTEDDEALDALAADGTLAGVKLDEIERMSTRELRAALREERERRKADAETTERLLEKKNKKIDELDRKLTEREKRTARWKGRTFEISLEVTEAAVHAMEHIDRLHQLRDVILNEDFGEDAEPAIQAMAEVYYDQVLTLFVHANNLMEACQTVFMGYKEHARPLLDQTDIYLDQQLEGPDSAGKAG